MRNGKAFGAQEAKEYCQLVRLASCEAEYKDNLDRMAADYEKKGDVARAEHVQAHLAATDIPLCKGDEVFMGIVNNPSEQTNNVLKVHTKNKKGKRLTLTGFMTKLMNVSRKQSLLPQLNTKVSFMDTRVCNIRGVHRVCTGLK